ncbi:general secretion pathway protein GspK [Myxococcota bacterium]|nr:general secretion pathway protein GspK [Myxococcota bacterium]
MGRGWRQRWREARGVALVLVLAGIAILAAFSAEFTHRSSIAVQSAHNLERQVQAYFHARSGMEIARLVVTSQKMVDQAVAAFGGGRRVVDLWQYAGKFAEIFSRGTVQVLGVDFINLKGQPGLGVQEGSFEVAVEPEDARISINAGASIQDRKALFTRLYPLLAWRVDPESRPTATGMDRKAAEVILNLIDWTDPDDERSDIDSAGNFVSAGGAGENVDYSRHGYRARNAPMDSLEEMRLVEGVSDDLFCRLKDLVTPYQTGKVNVNEADLQVLKALICDNLLGDRQVACGQTLDSGNTLVDRVLLLLDSCRRIKRELFLPPFANENEFLGFFQRLPEPFSQLLALNQGTLRALIGTRAKTLRVTSRGWAGSSGWQITAVIDQGSTNWLYWRETGFDASSLSRKAGTPSEGSRQ